MHKWPVCMLVYHMHAVPKQARRWHQIPNTGVKVLNPTQVLGVQPVSSGKAALTLNAEPSFQALKKHFLKLHGMGPLVGFAGRKGILSVTCPDEKYTSSSKKCSSVVT